MFQVNQRLSDLLLVPCNINKL